jgi:Concanavalin A-like lectin/glucanases superfamily
MAVVQVATGFVGGLELSVPLLAGMASTNGHVVMQFEGTTTTNNVQFYVNGNPDRFYSSALTTVNRNPTANVHIGALDASDTGGFTGLIDEVRVCNRILTPTEIQALASAVPSDLGPVITSSPTLTGNVSQPLSLSATVTDDGKPSGTLGYSWGQLSGPSTLTITNSSTLNASTIPGAPGSYGLFITASDGLVTTFANVSATITGQTYATWVTTNGLSGPAAAPTAINGNDRLNNFFKYALGLHATTTYQPGAAGLPMTSPQNSGGQNYLTLSFNGVASDVTYSVQHSTDLINWTPIQSFPSGTPPGQITVQDPVPIGAADKEFLRLLMTNP